MLSTVTVLCVPDPKFQPIYAGHQRGQIDGKIDTVFARFGADEGLGLWLRLHDHAEISIDEVNGYEHRAIISFAHNIATAFQRDA